MEENKISLILPWSSWGDGENVCDCHHGEDAVGGRLHDRSGEDGEDDDVNSDVEEDEGRHDVGVDGDQDIRVPEP